MLSTPVNVPGARVGNIVEGIGMPSGAASVRAQGVVISDGTLRVYLSNLTGAGINLQGPWICSVRRP